MAADKHYHQPAPHLPEALEDHQPDDMPAARNIIVLIISLLALCTIILGAIYYSYQPGTALKDPQKIEQTP